MVRFSRPRASQARQRGARGSAVVAYLVAVLASLLLFVVPVLKAVEVVGRRHPVLACVLMVAGVLVLIWLADLFEAVREVHGRRGVRQTAAIGLTSAVVTYVLLKAPARFAPGITHPLGLSVGVLLVLFAGLGVWAQRTSATPRLGLRNALVASVEFYGTFILGGGALLALADLLLREVVGIRKGCAFPPASGGLARPSLFDCGKTATEFAANVVDQLTVSAAAFVLVSVGGIAFGAVACRGARRVRALHARGWSAALDGWYARLRHGIARH